MTNKPDTEAPLVVKIVVELITYVIYFSWLSVLAAGALSLGLPPLTTIQDAVGGDWHGTAAAIILGALSIAALRVCYDALRARNPQETEPETPEPAPEPESAPGTKRKRKNKKRRRSRKR